MTRWWRWTLALLLCGAGVALGPAPAASGAPVVSAGAGTVVADLGVASVDAFSGPSPVARPGFSPGGGYFAYLVPAGESCDVRLFDVRARSQVGLSDDHVACDPGPVRWAADADTLVWQTAAGAGDLIVHAWDPSTGQVAALAPDAHVRAVSGLSADGRFLAFLGLSDTRPAPAVDAPGYAGYVYDRTSGASVPLSKPDVHVHFERWSPSGHTFLADTGGRTSTDAKTGGCFGSGTSCRVVPDIYARDNVRWAKDGSAVVVGAGSTAGTLLYDFDGGALTSLSNRVGFDNDVEFLGADARRVLVTFPSGAALWDRKADQVTRFPGNWGTLASPQGSPVLYRPIFGNDWRYLDTANPTAVTGAAYRGTDGYWNSDGSAFVGVGPAPGSYPFGCTSLRQWSPTTNTVSLFGPPGNGTCYRVPDPRPAGPRSAASGRFALFDKVADFTRGQPYTGTAEYVVDLRRHVLTGPLQGYVQSFAPAGSDVLALGQPLAKGTARFLLVDPTPVPDVDDKPRWSAATPAGWTRVDAAPGSSAHVQLGASDPQKTPVNLYFRWRATDGTPVASAPTGWSCDRRRLAAGATVADCTFAPPKDSATVRFLDVSATSSATGAQSDTRSYRVAVRHPAR